MKKQWIALGIVLLLLVTACGTKSTTTSLPNGVDEDSGATEPSSVMEAAQAYNAQDNPYNSLVTLTDEDIFWAGDSVVNRMDRATGEMVEILQGISVFEERGLLASSEVLYYLREVFDENGMYTMKRELWQCDMNGENSQKIDEYEKSWGRLVKYHDYLVVYFPDYIQNISGASGRYELKYDEAMTFYRLDSMERVAFEELSDDEIEEVYALVDLSAYAAPLWSKWLGKSFYEVDSAVRGIRANDGYYFATENTERPGQPGIPAKIGYMDLELSQEIWIDLSQEAREVLQAYSNVWSVANYDEEWLYIVADGESETSLEADEYEFTILRLRKDGVTAEAVGTIALKLAVADTDWWGRIAIVDGIVFYRGNSNDRGIKVLIGQSA